MMPTAYSTEGHAATEAEVSADIRTANVIVRYALFLSMVPVAATVLNVTRCTGLSGYSWPP